MPVRPKKIPAATRHFDKQIWFLISPHAKVVLKQRNAGAPNKILAKQIKAVIGSKVM